MFKKFSGIFGGKKEKAEDTIPEKDHKRKKYRITLYYSLFKKTRCRFLPQLCNARYEQSIRAFEEYQIMLLNKNPIIYSDLVRVFPIPFVFIAPRKKAITYFAIYSGALAEYYRHMPPASYTEFASAAGVTPMDIKMFVKGRLMLYKTVTPFRIVLGFPVYTKSKQSHINNQKLVVGAAEQVFSKFATPSKLLNEIYEMAKKAGIAAALQYTYTIVHASDRLSKIIRTTRNPRDIERIAMHITQRYNQLISSPRPPSIISSPQQLSTPATSPQSAQQRMHDQPQKTTKPAIPLPVDEIAQTATKVVSSLFSGFGKLAKGITKKFEEQEETPTKSKRYCPSCGVIVPENAKFCPNCGAKLI